MRKSLSIYLLYILTKISENIINLTRKKVFITGGGSGIGFQLAKQLSFEGCAISICGRDKAKLEHAKQTVTNLQTYPCNISSWEQQDQLVEDLRRNNNLPDIIVNNAAVIQETDFAKGEASWEQISTKIEINLLAPIRLVHPSSSLVASFKGTA